METMVGWGLRGGYPGWIPDKNITGGTKNMSVYASKLTHKKKIIFFDSPREAL